MLKGLRFPNWEKWQGRGTKDVVRMRDKRAKKHGRETSGKPFAMGYVIVATTLGIEFESFAEIVGGSVAESYLIRALQYAGLHDAFRGSIRVPADLFGGMVLTRRYDRVPEDVGASVYQAFVDSCICVEEEFGPAVKSVPNMRSELVPNSGSEHVPNNGSEPVPNQDPNPPRARGLSCPVVPCPVVSDDSPPTPRGGARGTSTSSQRRPRNGTAVVMPKEDRDVFEALWRRIVNAKEPFVRRWAPKHERGAWRFHADDEIGNRANTLRDTLLSTSPDVAGIIAFIDEFSTAGPDVTEEVRSIRATRAMAKKSRRRSAVATDGTGRDTPAMRTSS